MKDEVRDSRAAEEGGEEADETDDGGFLPAGAEDLRVKLRAREKSQYDSAGSREECDPRLLRAEKGAADAGPDDELGDCADDDFGEGGRDAQLDGDENGDERETDPDGGEKPSFSHETLP